MASRDGAEFDGIVDQLRLINISYISSGVAASVKLFVPILVTGKKCISGSLFFSNLQIIFSPSAYSSFFLSNMRYSLALINFLSSFYIVLSTAQNVCGPNVGSCAANECCSVAGFCGTSPDYCISPDCQFRYGPACDANHIPSGKNTTSIPRDKVGSVQYGADGIYNCVNTGDVALTFDDGPSPYTSHILDVLDRYNAKATFFISGNNNGKGSIDTNSQWSSLIQRMYNGGHQVASHTWSHADLGKLSSNERKNEMIKNEMALRNILGVIPTYMRPPYSSCSAESGCEDDMKDLGYHITYFDLDTQDYLNDSPDRIGKSKTIFKDALIGKPSTDSEFLAISHDIHEQTSEQLVDYMLQNIQARGFKAVTVGTCLNDPKQNWYRSDRATPRYQRMKY